MILSKDQVRLYFEHSLPGQPITSTREVKLKCRFHDDQTPSLSVNLEKGTWFCHAGCGGGGLKQFEQKLNGGTLEEAFHRVLEVVNAGHLFESQKSKPEAIYTYCDAQGREIFQKLRYEGKRFSQRRRLSDGRYEFKLGDIKKPLYRLPEVITANVAIICEGEKDADRIASLNLSEKDQTTRVAATTNFDGAGKWRDEYSPSFANKRAVILADNDQPGRDHAEKVAASVSKFAAGVRIVHLPGLAEHGDVSDWLDAGNTDEQLIAEIKKAPTWTPKERPHVMLVDAVQFAATAPTETPWLVENIIQEGGNGIIVGEPKAGKSIFSIDLLLAVATGTKFLGFSVPRRRKCALVSREDYPGMTQRRIVQLFRGSDRKLDIDGWMWVNTRLQTPTFLLSDDLQVCRLIEEFRREKIEFACFDVFRKLHNEDENDNQSMSKVLDQLTRIQNEAGCAIALVHHTSKDLNGSIFRRIRGASAIHGWTEWALGVSVINPEVSNRNWTRKIEFETKAACASDPVYVNIEEQGDGLRLNLTDPPERSRPPRMVSDLMSDPRRTQ